jgi:hypothetical protein
MGVKVAVGDNATENGVSGQSFMFMLSIKWCWGAGTACYLRVPKYTELTRGV